MKTIRLIPASHSRRLIVHHYVQGFTERQMYLAAAWSKTEGSGTEFFARGYFNFLRGCSLLSTLAHASLADSASVFYLIKFFVPAQYYRTLAD